MLQFSKIENDMIFISLTFTEDPIFFGTIDLPTYNFILGHGLVARRKR